MKVVSKNIDMAVWTTKEGKLKPIRFRYKDDDDIYRVVEIGRVIYSTTEKAEVGNIMIFRCQSLINGTEWTYDIKYEVNTMKWILFRM